LETSRWPVAVKKTQFCKSGFWEANRQPFAGSTFLKQLGSIRMRKADPILSVILAGAAFLALRRVAKMIMLPETPGSKSIKGNH
jgi:hypothetical protein